MPHGSDDLSGLPAGTWMSPGQHVADGGQGSVHFWVKVDENYTVVDRLVIKDSWSRDSTEEPIEYDGIYEELVRKNMDLGVSVSGSIGDAPVDERFYKEAYIQGLLSPDSGVLSHSMPLRGYKRGNKPDPWGCFGTTHWRLYMDHLHSGDMDTMISKSVRKDMNGFNVTTPIPEPFIWWTLYCLTSALIQIEKLTRARPKAREAKDETIVMMDMKPNNIFLAPPGGPKFPVYPRPVLGDFGGAHLTFKEEVSNVWGVMDQLCTTGFVAPEMNRMTRINEDDMRDHQYESMRVAALPVYSWTNVWQLGRCIECMMRATRFLDDVDWANEKEPQRESQIKKSPPVFPYSPGFQYSQDLLRIVYECQLFNPEDRPTPTELLEMINDNISHNTKFMDSWGTEDWIIEQEGFRLIETDREKLEVARKEKIERTAAGKLNFLHDYEDKRLAERYADLNMDIPVDCALVWGGKEAEYKIGQAVVPQAPVDTPQKPDKKRSRSESSDDETFLDTRLRKKPRL